jgi:hypothetical protein
MIPGHSGAPGPSRSMNVFLEQANGCGRTQLIHLKHNLILRIEYGRDHHARWREELYNIWDEREGAQHRDREGNDTESEEGTELQCARHRLMSDGQKFRNRLMKKLFDSEISGALRRT